MRLRTLLLSLPLLIARPETARSAADTPSADAARRVATDSVPVSVRWNRLVPRFLDETTERRRALRLAAAGDPVALGRLPQPPMLFRVYALLGVAQHAATGASLDDRTVSADAAIATASAAVLAEVFTDSVVRASIARELERDLARARTAARGGVRAMAGQRLGDDVARRVLASAPPLDFAAGMDAKAPTGPGKWYSAPGVPPMGIFFGRSRPWVMDSASQFRPALPLAFGSPEFHAALEEVRRVARALTPEQARLARRWSAADPWAVWNETAANALLRHRVPAVEAARVLAVMNVAASDALVACFEAKYHYWTIRPSQVDTTLVLPDSVGLPNFPAFPSGHACSAGAFDAVLGHYLPQERAEFTRLAEEQAMARLYGGVHYRYDNDAGLALGRTVARYVVERERTGGLSGWRAAAAGRTP